MTLYQVAVVACRGMALYFFSLSAVQLALSLYAFLQLFFNLPQSSRGLENYAGGGILGVTAMFRVVAAMVLWWGAELFAAAMIPRNECRGNQSAPQDSHGGAPPQKATADDGSPSVSSSTAAEPRTLPAVVPTPSGAGTRSSPVSINAEELMIVVFSSIGIYIFLEALADLGNSLFDGFVRVRMLNVSWSGLDWASLVASPVLQLVLAIWLAIGAKGVARGVRWLRTAKTPLQE